MPEFEREVARCEGFEVGVSHDHGGHLMMYGTFHYDGGGQGFGLVIDGNFIKRFLGVFNAERPSQVNGKHCWVTHDNTRIMKIEPLLPDEGKPFSVLAWSQGLQEVSDG